MFRAVGNRCAVDFKEPSINLEREACLSILKKKGFQLIDIDIIALARQCIGNSKYQRGAHPKEAPAIVDCSGFVKWLYGAKGIWLPRRSIQQRDYGEIVDVQDIRAMDLVFTSGHIDYFIDDEKDGVGHVGIATDSGTVVHAANKKVNVIETPLDDFTKDCFRGVRRYVKENSTIDTLVSPEWRGVETSDDIKWIILQSL